MFPISDVIPSRTTPVVTVGLIVANAAVFLYELQLSRPELQLFAFMFGVVPAHFAPATLVTSMFIHEGWMHLLGNMLYLWIFGDNVEDNFGPAKFLVFYLLCGVAATFAQVLVSSTSSVPNLGASGAIAGVLDAYIVMFLRGQVRVMMCR